MTDTPKDNSPHALYRFYDASEQLLYVGVTLNPARRWSTHSQEKPWWAAVANITVETYSDRRSVLDAERAAILAERPRHNVIHNQGTTKRPMLMAQTERLYPFQVGDWVALGLTDGRCPVGQVAAIDGEWVAVRLCEWMLGTLTDNIVAVRWREIARALVRFMEDAETESPGRFGSGPERVIDTEDLGLFQTAWTKAHFGDDGRDPIAQSMLDIKRERREWDRS